MNDRTPQNPLVCYVWCLRLLRRMAEQCCANGSAGWAVRTAADAHVAAMPLGSRTWLAVMQDATGSIASRWWFLVGIYG